MKKSMSSRFILMGVGVLLILLGTQSVAVKVAGTTAQATVTKVEQIVSETSDKMDYNYHIAYRFTANGKDYTGSLERKRVRNVALLPVIGASVSIKYLAAAPFLNGPADASPMTGVFLGAAGVAMFVVAQRMSRRPAAEAAESEYPPVT